MTLRNIDGRLVEVADSETVIIGAWPDPPGVVKWSGMLPTLPNAPGPEVPNDAPKCCPVCQCTEHETYSDRKGPWGYRFTCGAYWMDAINSKWYAPCTHAMDAAVRAGATWQGPIVRESGNA